MIRTGGMMGLVAAAVLLGAAAPATLGPPVTGTMYNGNNAHPPQLAQPQPGQASPAAQNSRTGATGADLGGGHAASSGGGN